MVVRGTRSGGYCEGLLVQCERKEDGRRIGEEFEKLKMDHKRLGEE